MASDRKTRRRKQKGGVWYNPFTWFSPAPPVQAPPQNTSIFSQAPPVQAPSQNTSIFQPVSNSGPKGGKKNRKTQKKTRK